MNHDGMVVVMLRLSCVLSIIGAIVVMGVCSYSQLVDKQKGKQLIFWLSVTDLGSSVVYFMSSFEKDDGVNTSLCKTYALLGIFFPVASFLWTDFIAYYLWTMIVSRKIRNDEEWGVMMRYFHLISWGVSAFCILIVGATGHAGRDSNENSVNTGGWCWVRASDNSNLILWELIGGKFVEWTSCFIIVPYLYFKTASMLIKLDNTWAAFIRNGHDESEGSCLLCPCQICSRIWTHLTDPSQERQTEIRMDSVPPVDSATSVAQNPYGNSTVCAPPADQQSQLESLGRQDSQQMNKPKFWKFYTRMALVPVLFFLARVWGSLRVVIYAIASDNATATDSADGWLRTMQAIFDPSQGFLNALLFVFLSSKNMNAIGDAITSSPLYVSFRQNLIVQFLFGRYSPSEAAKTERRNESSSSKLNDSSALYLCGGSQGVLNKMPLLSDDEQSDFDSSFYSEDQSTEYRGGLNRGWSGDDNGICASSTSSCSHLK